MLVDLAAVVVTALALVGLVSWLICDTRTHYGPIVYGNRRWRREAPQRAAAVAHREALAALTPADRDWLTERGWRP